MTHRGNRSECDTNLRETCSVTCLPSNTRNNGPRRTKSGSSIFSDKQPLVITNSDKKGFIGRPKRRRPNIRRPDRRPRPKTCQRKRKQKLDKHETKFLEIFSRLGLSGNEDDLLGYTGSRGQGRSSQRLREDIVLQQWRSRQSHRDKVLQQKRNNRDDEKNEINTEDEMQISDETEKGNGIEELVKLFQAFKISEIARDNQRRKDNGKKRKLPEVFNVHDEPTDPKRICLHIVH